jgi:hypothetical protein
MRVKIKRSTQVKRSTQGRANLASQRREERLVSILREHILCDQLERERLRRSPLARIQVATLSWLKSAPLARLFLRDVLMRTGDDAAISR